jgi:hypothetical protein
MLSFFSLFFFLLIFLYNINSIWTPNVLTGIVFSFFWSRPWDSIWLSVQDNLKIEISTLWALDSGPHQVNRWSGGINFPYWKCLFQKRKVGALIGRLASGSLACCDRRPRNVEFKISFFRFEINLPEFLVEGALLLIRGFHHSEFRQLQVKAPYK